MCCWFKTAFIPARRHPSHHEHRPSARTHLHATAAKAVPLGGVLLGGLQKPMFSSLPLHASPCARVRMFRAYVQQRQ